MPVRLRSRVDRPRKPELSPLGWVPGLTSANSLAVTGSNTASTVSIRTVCGSADLCAARSLNSSQRDVMAGTSYSRWEGTALSFPDSKMVLMDASLQRLKRQSAPKYDGRQCP